MIKCHLWALPQNHCISFCVSSRKGLVMSDRHGKSLLRYCARPNSHCTPALSVGAGMSVMALTLTGSTHSPLSVATCLIKGTSFSCRVSLSIFSFTFLSLRHSKNVSNVLSWLQLASWTVLPLLFILKSSATTSIPLSPSISSCIVR